MQATQRKRLDFSNFGKLGLNSSDIDRLRVLATKSENHGSVCAVTSPRQRKGAVQVNLNAMNFDDETLGS
jgi:hypothetical protein